MRESKFQRRLISKIKDLFPGAMVLKNDPGYIQGIPDLLVLYGNTWAALECKRGEHASHRPNQDYYIENMNKMSYASFVCPENEGEVLNGLQAAFGSGRETCVSRGEQVSLDKL